jgi:hypothetical protein
LLFATNSFALGDFRGVGSGFLAVIRLPHRVEVLWIISTILGVTPGMVKLDIGTDFLRRAFLAQILVVDQPLVTLFDPQQGRCQ